MIGEWEGEKEGAPQHHVVTATRKDGQLECASFTHGALTKRTTIWVDPSGAVYWGTGGLRLGESSEKFLVWTGQSGQWRWNRKQ